MPDPRPDASESSTALIARARAGDRSAIDLLVRRYLPALRRWAHGRLPRNTRDLDDTDDLIQGTLIRALGRLQQFDPRQPHAFLFYLRRALLNQVRDKARGARRRPIRGELHEDLLDGRPTPLTAAVNADAMRSYERALSRLSEKTRAAVVMRLELGLDYAEVGELLGGCSANAARLQVVRAVRRLAQEMGSHA